MDQARYTPKKMDIVSPELCDDVLSYVGHTLQKHRNCDILDLSPGAGVWSSKLHEYLKPRTHILVEPHAAAYKNQLGPLLEQKGSTYKLVEKDPHKPATYEELVNEGHFPHQTRYDADDPRLAEQNNTLLITGCLTFTNANSRNGSTSFDRRILQNLLWNAWDQKLAHVYGKVRMLVWIKDHDVSGFITKSVSHKGTDPHATRLLFDIRQVVAARPGKNAVGRTTRDVRYMLQSAARTVKSMRELGLSIPPHRQSVLHKLAIEIVDRGVENDDLGNDGSLQLVDEALHRGLGVEGLLTEERIDFVLGEIAIANDPSIEYISAPTGQNKTGQPTPRIKMSKWGRMHGYNKAHQKYYVNLRRDRCKQVDLGMEIFDFECKLMVTHDEIEKQKIQAKLSSLNEEFLEAAEQSIPSLRPYVPIDLDERLALNSRVLPLHWDRRRYEPLEHRSDEVWPAGKVSLVDFEPEFIPQNEKLPGEFVEYLRFVKELQNGYKNTVPQALEVVDSGASQLVDSVPEVFDPAKGGRPDLNNFRARLLSMEMITALYKAYMEWPFRSPNLQSKVGRNRKRI
ncbi:S-adenosyl-L-methionine-dependent methyltransferase [Lophium mytilinum]|uniref:S-adenosyl-L-methionine-dependent methyltransferase n=1 Tax=Lophium mytilinum TaxID=390894 RepID=A0A6A6RCK0_9PEZI|nr:S-adenosyl-L-methionine-dependent methyltransferase [Lophium mytilinum]